MSWAVVDSAVQIAEFPIQSSPGSRFGAASAGIASCIKRGLSAVSFRSGLLFLVVCHRRVWLTYWIVAFPITVVQFEAR